MRASKDRLHSWTRESRKPLPVSVRSTDAGVHVDRARRSTSVGARPSCVRVFMCVRRRAHTTLIAASAGAPNTRVYILNCCICFASGAINLFSFCKFHESNRVICVVSFPPISGALAKRIPPPPRVCVRRHTRTELSGREVTPGDTATTKSRVVTQVSARRLPARGADSSRRTRAASSGSVGSHGYSARAYKNSCAVHREIRLARRHLAVALYARCTPLQLAP